MDINKDTIYDDGPYRPGMFWLAQKALLAPIISYARHFGAKKESHDKMPPPRA